MALINQAENAKEETEIAQWEDRIDIAILNAKGKNEEVTMDIIIQELIDREIISDASKVDKETGAITTNDPSYVITGKLEDYIERPTIGALKLGDRVYYKDKNNIERECYVLYDASSPYGVQIITKDVVDTVELGANDSTLIIGATDGINDPIDANSTNFEKSRISYNNALRTLYNKAQEYLNTTYATSARCVESKLEDLDWDARTDEDGNPINESDLFTSSYSYMNPYNNTLKVGENDGDITDWTQMGTIKSTTNVDIKISNTEYWLASRKVTSGNYDNSFSLRFPDTYGDLFSMALCYVDYNGTEHEGGASYGFRPVFTLRPEVKIKQRADGSYDLVV